MIDVQKLLYEICEDKRVYDDGIDLIDSGILDSYAFIELLSRLEDYGIILHPTRIDRTKLHTVQGIEELIKINQHSNENNI
ncbi:MAG: D-alanine--poly(phosphoribitol) ligase subunit 2 [Spirochaetia bacterium]|nr:D-alanine--poly(phosphoribitol) ligase subunit 2 [Spirochaetia bacterium]